MPIDVGLLKRIRTNDPTLRALDLNSRYLTDDDIQELAVALESNTNLVSLNLSGNHISDEGAIALAFVTTLISLCLNDNQISDIGTEALAMNSSLCSLYLSNNRLSRMRAEAFATNKNLVVLDISHNSIGSEGIKALAANTSIIWLNVSSCLINDAGAEALAVNKKITSLNISNNSIGDKGAKALAVNKSLNWLNASDCLIRDEGAESIAMNTTLISVDLSNNMIGDSGAYAFASNSTLSFLDLNENSIESDLNSQLMSVIDCNDQYITYRRDQFIHKMIILALDKANDTSLSLWSKLPMELILYIFSFIQFEPSESIGKNTQQILSCVEFIFSNAAFLKDSLKASLTTQHDFKILERRKNGKAFFRFFPPPPQMHLAETRTHYTWHYDQKAFFNSKQNIYSEYNEEIEKDVIQLSIIQNRLEDLQNTVKKRILSDEEINENSYLQQRLQELSDRVENWPNFMEQSKRLRR